MSAQPLPAEVTVTAAALGGVPTAEITVDGIDPRHVVLYFHGGVYVIGDAFLAAELASQVGRRTQARVISVDYRLAPEHPYPAAVDDALAAYEALLRMASPSDIVFAGESAGGGLAIATLVNARDHGLPLPAAAYVMSPLVDLTLAGATMKTRHGVDPLFSRELLVPRAADYTSGQDAALGPDQPHLRRPVRPAAPAHPGRIPRGLLDDAVRLARQAATADVEVTLEITPGCRTSSRPITPSSTKGPRHWTEPGSSCRRTSPVPKQASPESRGVLVVSGVGHAQHYLAETVAIARRWAAESMSSRAWTLSITGRQACAGDVVEQPLILLRAAHRRAHDRTPRPVHLRHRDSGFSPPVSPKLTNTPPHRNARSASGQASAPQLSMAASNRRRPPHTGSIPSLAASR